MTAITDRFDTAEATLAEKIRMCLNDDGIEAAYRETVEAGWIELQKPTRATCSRAAKPASRLYVVVDEGRRDYPRDETGEETDTEATSATLLTSEAARSLAPAAPSRKAS